MHYVSTAEERSSEFNSAVKFQWETRLMIKMKNTANIKEYMKKRRADAEFRKKENENLRQRRYNNIEKTREEKRRAAKKGK